MRRSSRRRSRSSHGQREDGTFLRPDAIFTVCALTIALAATIPLGGVGFLSTQIVAALCVIAGVGGGALLRAQPGCLVWWSKKPPPRLLLAAEGHVRRPPNPAQWAGWAALALIVWCAIQMIHWPADWIRRMWRGDAGLYREVAADAGGAMSLAVDRFVSLHTSLLWLGLGLLAWACSRQIRSGRRVSLALHGVMLIGLFQTGYGVFFAGASGRMQGTFSNPDALGGLLALTIPVTLGFLLSRFKEYAIRGRVGWRRLFYRLGTGENEWTIPWLGFILAVQLIGIFFTGSRGAFLSAAAACGALLAWYGMDRPKSIGAIAVAVVLLAGFAAIFSVRGLDQSVLDRTMGEAVDWRQARMARVEIWQAAIRLCITFPLGLGPGGTAVSLPMFQTGMYGRFRLDYAHNDYLQFLGDLGLPAFSALLLLLGLVLWRGAKAARRGPEGLGGSVWLRRGVLMAVIAGLLHAFVEFNLSARPGSQVTFFILCGILWGSVACTSEPNDNRAPSQRGRRFHVFRIAAAALGAAALVWLSANAACAWLLRDAAAAAVNLEQDDYLWFRRPSVPREKALDTMIRASRIAPDSTFIRRSVAETRLVLHELRLQETARGILRSTKTTVATNLLLEVGNPEHDRALHMAELALGVEEAETLRAALEDANAAVSLAPWGAQARLVRGGILLRETALNMAGAEAFAAGWRDLDIAARLYPLNAGVLLRACFELARAAGRQGLLPERERVVDALLDWGSRALAFDPSMSDTIMDAWWTARVPLARVLAMPDVPVAVLWRLYDLLERRGGSAEAQTCLAALKSRIEEARLPEASALWSQTARKKWAIRRDQYRVRWVCESVKHLLRDGDWTGIQAFKTEREEAWRKRLRVELDKLDLSSPASASLRRLRLRELGAAMGLDPELTVESSLLELDAGMPMASVQDPLAEVLLTAGNESVNLARLEVWRGAMPDAPFLAGLLAARESEAAGQWDEAAAALADILDARQTPRRFLHRVLLWQARMLERAGRGPERLDALRQAARSCPADPDVTDALAAAGDPADRVSGHPGGGDPALDIGFIGRRMVLRRAGLEEDAALKGGLRLNLAWRFWGRLPSDLQISTSIRDKDGRSLFQKTVAVGQENEAAFGGGMPSVGSAWTLTVPIPPRAARGRFVQVSLKSGTTLLFTDEGLSKLDLAMDKLPRRVPRRE